MIVAKPIHPAEPDLLAGNENQDLRFMSTAGVELAKLAPPHGGWTHEALQAARHPIDDAWDAYLGAQWVGSSEL